MRYTPDLLRDYNQAESFIVLGRSAFSAQEFAQRAKRYRLTYEQQKIVDEIVDKKKLESWNEWARGEKVG